MKDGVASRAILDNFVLVQYRCVCHARWLEDPFRQKGRVWLATDSLNDHSQQKIALVAVIPFFSRGKTESVLARRFVHRRSRNIQSPHQAAEVFAQSR